MMNKAERAEHEELVRQRDSLQRKYDRLQAEREKVQDTVTELGIAVDDFELAVGKLLKQFRQRVVQIITGTPPEDQPR
jgi:uncharacterized protein YlxW (UPF0749 family)